MKLRITGPTPAVPKQEIVLAVNAYVESSCHSIHHSINNRLVWGVRQLQSYIYWHIHFLRKFCYAAPAKKKF